MKLLFLCAAVATAARTPPTISLSLAREHLPANQQQARHTCEVGDGTAVCPLPTCKAYDHHDLHCGDDSKCGALSGAALSDYCHSNGYSQKVTSNSGASVQPVGTERAECTHEFECGREILLINDNNVPTTDYAAHCGSDKWCRGVDRSLRALWEFRYSAVDRSNQAAQNVSFSLLFRDTQKPRLNTEFGPRDTADWLVRSTLASDAAGANERRDEAEACNMPTNFAEQNHVACSWNLPQAQPTVRASDGYDGDVTHLIKFKLQNPSGHWVHGGAVTGTLSEQWNGANLYHCTKQGGCDPTRFADWTLRHEHLVVDTEQIGSWKVFYQSCDLAGEFGLDSDNNCFYQTVTIEVTDNQKPQIRLDGSRLGDYGARPWKSVAENGGGPGEVDQTKQAERDVLECGVDTYDEKGGKCFDLLESWNHNPSTSLRPGDCLSGTGPTWCPKEATVTYANGAQMPTSGVDTTTITDAATTTYRVHYDCADEFNNQATRVVRTVTVRDTRPPVLTLLGALTIENSAGAYGSISAERRDDPNSCHLANTRAACLDKRESGNYKQHQAHPCLWTDGACVPHSWEDEGGLRIQYIEGQATCTDECDQNPHIKKTLHYGLGCSGALVGDGEPSNFPEYRKGDYSIKYVCSDGNGGDAPQGRARLTDTACRDIRNVDHTRPVIIPLGSDHMTLEATHTGNYIDDGATCSDQVDGVISQNVEVSGEVVNLAEPGEYHVKYTCKDSSNRCNAAGDPDPKGAGGYPCAAYPAYRVVYVRQTACPTCYLRDCDHNYIKQAGNPNTLTLVEDERGLQHCQGDCDTDSDCVGPQGQPGHCAHDRSLDQLVAMGCKGAKHSNTADYCISHAVNTKRRTNDPYSCRAVQTEEACNDKTDEAVTLANGSADPTAKVCRWEHGSCEPYDLSFCQMYHEASFPFADPGAVCHDPYDGVLTGEAVTTEGTVDWKVTGSYTITYRACNPRTGLCSDGACRGRPNKYVRTVTVVDTLKPAIRLYYAKAGQPQQKVLIAKGAATDTGVHLEANSADDAAHDGYAPPARSSPHPLMGEVAAQHSGASWSVMAAVAAVAGVALLALGQRRGGEPVVSVPV